MSKARELADFVAAGNPLADGSITFDEIADGNLTITSGTIKLDGNYPNGVNNVALGNAALDTASGANGYSVAIGTNALTAMTSGGSNVGVGYASGAAITTGGNNVAVGTEALDATTTGSSNVAIGSAALRSNTTASNNTAVGYQAMYLNTTGVVNAAFGRETLASNTSGSFNTAFGTNALFSNTTASNNTAVGYQAGYSNTTGTNNTIIGYQAGYYNVNSDSTLIGQSAGFNLSYSGTGRNTFIGFLSGSSVTSGRYNTILGSYNGNQGGLDIRTSSNNIVLSDGDGNPRMQINGSGSVLVGTTAGDTSNTTGITQQLYSNGAYITVGKTSSAGNGEGYINFIRNGSIIGNVSQASTSSVSYNTTSDYRLKENVVNLEGATARLVQLQPKRFEWINDTDGAVWDGFLAHEVQTVVPEAITGTHNEVEVWKDGEELPDGVSVGDNKLDDDGNTIPKYQGIDQSKLVPLLVATIKELEARITALENA